MKYRILIPAVSAVTAGGAAYPFVFSESGSGVSSGTPTVLNLESPSFENSRSLLGIDSGKASSLSVSTTNPSSSTVAELKAESPGLSIDTKGEIMQANSLPIKGLRGELDKENQVEHLSEEQLREFEEAIKNVKRVKQGFETAKDKVVDYRKTAVSKGDTTYTRTFDESGSQVLTRQHRISLMKFFEMYSKLRVFKREHLSKINSLSRGSEFLSDSRLTRRKAKIEEILTNLSRIDWVENEIKIFADTEDELNWGWGKKWKENPFRLFYSDKNTWKSKVTRIRDAQKISALNNKDQRTCSTDFSGTDTLRDQTIRALCDQDHDRFTKLVEGYKSEIELDIASWLLDQMNIILKEREAPK